MDNKKTLRNSTAVDIRTQDNGHTKKEQIIPNPGQPLPAGTHTKNTRKTPPNEQKHQLDHQRHGNRTRPLA